MRGRSYAACVARVLAGTLVVVLTATWAMCRRHSDVARMRMEEGAQKRAPLPLRSPKTEPPCPGDMVHVETSFCPNVDRRCVELEYERANHLGICHAFAHGEREHCNGDERPLSFCMDRYEYPNRKGAHPSWMVSWYDAQATCMAHDKRLCWSSEWTAACEGPEHTPFPYGWERNHTLCNIDNLYIEPRKAAPRLPFLFYSNDKKVALDELSRLDQSVPSGSMESCQSGFGVYDLTGNLDEWVSSDEPARDKSKWAGLKGGGWGHVRNQCRAMTTSHDPDFTYYFVGFRCCRDAPGQPAWKPSAHATPPPMVRPADVVAELAEPLAAGPGPSKVKYSWNSKAKKARQAGPASQPAHVGQ
jgi:hypothetical protein